MRIRNGMWAISGGLVGIVVSFNDVATEFHVVGADGVTKEVKIVPTDSVAQASLHDIPESRRPDKKTAKQFGYA